MTPSLVVALLWLVAANVPAMLPSRDRHWAGACVRVALGIPLLGWVAWRNGPWVGLICLFGGVSVLRWPVYFLGRWICRRVASGGSDTAR